MDLPQQAALPVHRLAACFNDTSATYKFYWFLSLLQAVEEGQTTIPKRHLFARMVANAWYTVNYFKVSFGKQDKLQEAIIAMKEGEGLPIDAAPATILSTLIHSLNRDTRNGLNYFNKQVPHWFLSLWLPRLDMARTLTRMESCNCQTIPIRGDTNRGGSRNDNKSQFFVLQRIMSLSANSTVMATAANAYPHSIEQLGIVTSPNVLSCVTNRWTDKSLNIILLDWISDIFTFQICYMLNTHIS